MVCLVTRREPFPDPHTHPPAQRLPQRYSVKQLTALAGVMPVLEKKAQRQRFVQLVQDAKGTAPSKSSTPAKGDKAQGAAAAGAGDGAAPPSTPTKRLSLLRNVRNRVGGGSKQEKDDAATPAGTE